MKHLMLLLLLFAIVTGIKARDKVQPSGLTTDLLRAPDKAVITNPNPRFGWIVPQEVISQSAFRIMVASAPELLENENPDFWDSGRISSVQSANIIYQGKPLLPDSSFWWMVKVWGDEGNESNFSRPQHFYTGKFDRHDNTWEGQSNWVKSPQGTWVAEDRQMAAMHMIKPESFLQTGSNSWFASFEKAAFATLDLEVSSETAGERLTVFLGERKNNNNTVNKEPGLSNIGFFKAELPLKKGTHTYRLEIPRHDARYPHSQKLPPFYPEVLPFRYVEAQAGHGVQVKSLTQVALIYYFDDASSMFSSSDENLNQVWDLCKYTLKATPFLSLYADGNRERMPYEADAYIQQLGHYATDREYSVARYTLGFLLSHASWPTEWQMHTVMMAREHWMYTGDTTLLGRFYDLLKRKTLMGLSEEPHHLISTRTGKVTPEFQREINLNAAMRDIVDWPAGTPAGQKQASNAGPYPEGERDGYEFTEFNIVVNAFHYYSLKCMAEIAGALGKSADTDFFETRAGMVRQGIMQNMFDSERGVFTDGIGTSHASLHASMFPLAFNMVPEELIPGVAAYIKTKGMACSVYGAQYLLEALYNAGEAEYALGLMTSEDKRSWMNMIKAGSTMTTEAWDEYFKPNLTWNHAWGAAPANIIPRRLAGIMPIEPGFKTFSVNPQPEGPTARRTQQLFIKGPYHQGGYRMPAGIRPDQLEA